MGQFMAFEDTEILASIVSFQNMCTACIHMYRSLDGGRMKIEQNRDEIQRKQSASTSSRDPARGSMLFSALEIRAPGERVGLFPRIE